jgi:hypothetical protein
MTASAPLPPSWPFGAEAGLAGLFAGNVGFTCGLGYL